MKILHMFYKWISGTRDAMMITMLGLMILFVFMGVFWRYILNDSLSWTDETARYLMVWLGFLGMSFAAQTNDHIGVMMLIDKFPPRLRHAILVFDRLVVLIFLFVLAFYSLRHMRSVWFQTSPSLEISMAWPYSAVTVGALWMIFENIRHLFIKKNEKG